MNIHVKALTRYAALNGTLDELSHEQRMQAIADRKEFGTVYVAKKGCGYERAALALRFMHEVCNIPLAQACAFFIRMIGESGAFRLKQLVPASWIASQFLEEAGNILVAEATAALYCAAAQGTPWGRYWQTVLETVRCGQRVD